MLAFIATPTLVAIVALVVMAILAVSSATVRHLFYYFWRK